MNIRDLVYKSLLAVEKEGKYSNLECSSKIDQYNLEAHDRSFYTALFYGVIEKKITLNYWITSLTGKSTKRLDLSVLLLLEIGIYQIVFMDKIPDSAAVNESVKLASRYASRAKGFINGVLRNTVLKKKDLPFPDREREPILYFSVRYSIPEWICRIWKQDYPLFWEEIVEASEEIPPITFRVNTLKISRDSFLTKYPSLSACIYSPYGVIAPTSLPISDFEPLQYGLCYVQDEASQIASLVLDPQKNDFILDVCCAPGGKSFGAALLSDDSAEIVSMDLHGNKLSLVQKEAHSLGIQHIRVLEHDSTSPLLDYKEKADRVICDVPCSGLGVISKKSDLRYKDSLSIEPLPELQYKILVASSTYLKKGGVLVYSTCTLRKAENEDVIQRFLSEYSEFKAEPISVGQLSSQDGMLTLFPSLHHTDGFFIAKLRKL